MDESFLFGDYRKLTPKEQDVLHRLVSNAQGNICILKQDRIAALVPCHIQTVKVAYRRLQELGVIAVGGKHGEVILNPKKCLPELRFSADYKLYSDNFNEAYAPIKEKFEAKNAVKKASEKAWSRDEIAALPIAANDTREFDVKTWDDEAV